MSRLLGGRTSALTYGVASAPASAVPTSSTAGREPRTPGVGTALVRAQAPVDVGDDVFRPVAPHPALVFAAIVHLADAAHDDALTLRRHEDPHHLVVAPPRPHDAVRPPVLHAIHHVAALHQHFARDDDHAEVLVQRGYVVYRAENRGPNRIGWARR